MGKILTEADFADKVPGKTILTESDFADSAPKAGTILSSDDFMEPQSEPAPEQSPAPVRPIGVAEQFTRAAVPQVGPSAAAAAGALAGAELGLPLGPIGSAVGAIVVGGSAYFIAKKAQNAAIKATVGEKEAARQEAEMAEATKARPMPTMVGEFVGATPAMFAGGGVTKAAAGLKAVKAAAEMGRAASLGQKAVRTIPAIAGSGTAMGVMEGTGALGQKIDNPESVSWGDVADSVARGYLAGGAMGIVPGARTILGKLALKPAGDLAAMAVSNAVYDNVAHGAPIDPQKMFEEAKGQAPMFVLYNAAHMLTPEAFAQRRVGKYHGDILRAYGVNENTLKKMTPDERKLAYVEIFRNMTPEQAKTFAERAPLPVVEARRQVESAPGYDFNGIQDPAMRNDAKAEYIRSTVGRLFGKVPVRVYDTQAAMMADNPDAAKAARMGGGVQVAFFKDGRMYVALDGLATPEDVVRTVIHEGGGHAALDAMTEAERRALLVGIDRKTIRQRAREAAGADREMKGTALGYVEQVPSVDESLAILNENRVTNPSAYQRGVAALRKYMRKAVPGLRMNDNDIEVLMADARGRLAGGDANVVRAEPEAVPTLEEQAIASGAFADDIPKQISRVSQRAPNKESRREALLSGMRQTQPPSVVREVETTERATPTPVEPTETGAAEPRQSNSEVRTFVRTALSDDRIRAKYKPLVEEALRATDGDEESALGLVREWLAGRAVAERSVPNEVRVAEKLNRKEALSSADVGVLNNSGVSGRDLYAFGYRLNRATGVWKFVASPVTERPDAAPFDVEGLKFNGVQRIEGMEDQQVWTDTATGGTFFMPGDADKAAVEAHRDGSRKKFEDDKKPAPEKPVEPKQDAKDKPKAKVDAPAATARPDSSSTDKTTKQSKGFTHATIAREYFFDSGSGAMQSTGYLFNAFAGAFPRAQKQLMDVLGKHRASIDSTQDDIRTLAQTPEWGAIKADVIAAIEQSYGENSVEARSIVEEMLTNPTGVTVKRGKALNIKLDALEEKMNVSNGAAATVAAVQPISPAPEVKTADVAQQTPTAPRKPKLGEKPVWKRTQAEWRAQGIDEARKASPNQPEAWYAAQADRVHKSEVGRAIRQGRKVPDEVMRDYPDLVAKLAPQLSASINNYQIDNNGVQETKPPVIEKAPEAAPEAGLPPAKPRVDAAQRERFLSQGDNRARYEAAIKARDAGAARKLQAEFEEFARRETEAAEKPAETSEAKSEQKPPELMTPTEYEKFYSSYVEGEMNRTDKRDAIRAHKAVLKSAVNSRSVISSDSIDAYGIKLPEGYVREGDRYVFKPETTNAKEASNAAQEGKLAEDNQREHPRNGEGGAPIETSPSRRDANGGKGQAEVANPSEQFKRGTKVATVRNADGVSYFGEVLQTNPDGTVKISASKERAKGQFLPKTYGVDKDGRQIRKEVDVPAESVRPVDASADVSKMSPEELRKFKMAEKLDAAQADNELKTGNQSAAFDIVDNFNAAKERKERRRTDNGATRFRSTVAPEEKEVGGSQLEAGKAKASERKEKARFRSVVTPNQDKDYMEAVKKGDMQTAQRMVDEAAKRAGYTVGPFWHGDRTEGISKLQWVDGGWREVTTPSINVYTRTGKIKNTQSDGIYLTNDKEYASGFGGQVRRFFLRMNNPFYGKRDDGNVQDAILKRLLSMSDADKKKMLDPFGDGSYDPYNELGDFSREGFDNLLKKEFTESFNQARRTFSPSGLASDEPTFANTLSYAIADLLPTPNDFTKKLQSMGHDGQIDSQITGAKPGTMQIIVFDSNQIKSADAITRDDSGNVIPLSERFNEKSEDIRFRSVKKPVSDMTADELRKDVIEKGRGEKRYVMALPGTTEESRKFQRVMEEAYAENKRPQKIADIETAARMRYAQDPEAVKLSLLSGEGEAHAGTEQAQALAKLAFNDMSVKAMDSKATEAEVENGAGAGIEYFRKRSSAGRILQMGHDLYDTPESRRALLSSMLLSPNDAEIKRISDAGNNAAVLQDIRRKIAQRAIKTRESLKKIQAVWKDGNGVSMDVSKLTTDQLMDDVLMRQIMNEIQSRQGSRWGDMIHEYWRNSILSGPATQITNVVGNVLHGTMDLLVQRPLEAFLGKLARTEAAPTAHSIGNMWKAFANSLPAAVENAKRSWVSEAPVGERLGKLDTGKVSIPSKSVNVLGKTYLLGGKQIRLPQRMMLAADEFFRAIYHNMLVADYGTREFDALQAKDPKAFPESARDAYMAAAADPHSKAFEKAAKETSRLLFQGEPGPTAQALSRVVNDPSLMGFLLKFIFPFVKTPANIVDTSIRKSPLGIVNMLYKGGRGDFGGSPEARAEGVRLLSEQVVGLITMASIWGAIKGDDKDPLNRPRLTGSRMTGPHSSPGERESEMRNYPPMSIRFGDKWVSYARLDPLAGMLATMADVMHAWEQYGRGQGNDIPLTVFNSMKGNLTDKAYLQGLGDIIQIIESGDENKLAQFAQRIAGGFVPNAVRASLRAFDPYIRDMRNRNKGLDWLKTSAERLGQTAWPSKDIQPPPRYDVYGKPVEKEGSPLYNIFSPFRVQAADKVTKVDAMLKRYNDALPDSGDRWYPPPPQVPEIKRFGDKHPLKVDDDLFEKYQKLAGEYASRRLNASSFNYDNPTERDIDRIKQIYSEARSLAKNRIRFEVIKRSREAQTSKTTT